MLYKYRRRYIERFDHEINSACASAMFRAQYRKRAIFVQVRSYQSEVGASVTAYWPRKQSADCSLTGLRERKKKVLGIELPHHYQITHRLLSSRNPA